MAKFERPSKQATFIFAWEATQIDEESAGGPALYNAVTWPVQKVNNYAHNMRRSPSYSS